MNIGNMTGGMPFNPAMMQKVGQVMTMLQKGQDVKTIITTLKSQGLTPQSAEQMLCVAFPQIRQIKAQMAQSGLTPQEFLKQMAKNNNMSEQDLNQRLGGMLNN